MLHHTSGVPSKAPRASGDDPTLETHVRALAGVELAHRPGTVHEYASPNYQVLGTIVETVSGQTFGAYIDDGAYIDEHIFGPLGMERSFVSRGAARQADMASGGERTPLLVRVSRRR